MSRIGLRLTGHSRQQANARAARGIMHFVKNAWADPAVRARRTEVIKKGNYIREYRRQANMLKVIEKADGQSRWNKAADQEMIFVLLGRDAAAPHTIREWAKERIRLGKNTKDDHQILEALRCADFMESHRMPDWAKTCTYWNGNKCEFDPAGYLCECRPQR